MKTEDRKSNPGLATKILHACSRREEFLERSGDLEEAYVYLVDEVGRIRARVWFWGQVLKMLPVVLMSSLYWRCAMLRNDLKVTIRNLKRRKGYSFINIAGLAIGMACCILILLWVQDEVSYDRFHENGDRICRLIQREHTQKKKAITPAPYGPALKDDFAEIVEYARLGKTSRRLFQAGDKTFYESDLYFVDPSFLTMFSFPLLKGDSQTALSDPYSAVISERMADKYFGEDDPIGKSLTIQQSFEVIITGIMKPFPANSHLNTDFLGHFEICEKEFGRGVGWSNNSYTTYLQLAEGISINELGPKIEYMVLKYRPQSNTRVYLQPLDAIYLRSDFDYDFTGSGGIRATYVTIFSIVAFFVMAIACMNFINLSTAQSAKRAKEVGIRKVSGANRVQLIRQFLSESVVTSSFALIVALLLVAIILPAFNQLTGKQISMVSFWNGIGLAGFAIIALITGLVAGIYPAIVLSSFQPVSVLKSFLGMGTRGAGFRKSLVVLQFSLSVILIIGTVTVYKQLEHIQNTDLGYNKDHILVTRLRGDIKDQVEVAKIELMKSPHIEAVAVSSDITTNTYHSSSGRAIWWEGKDPDEDILMFHYDVDEDFIPMMGMEIVSGRNFSATHSMDAGFSYIVNETAVRVMNMEDPIGKRFAVWGPHREGMIIGVVEDFHFQSLHEKIGPMVFRIRPEGYYYLLSRVQAQNAGDAVKVLETVCKRLNPEHPFDYFFLDEAFDRLYRSEERMSTITTVFAGLAVFISCLGLFGLTSFMTEQRRKEIGIRKVLGASVPEVVRLFSKEFIILVVTANVIAWPVAYMALNRWLQGFAYRTSMGIWIFLVSAGVGLFVALATVCSQSAVAAMANPVDSLKYE